MSTNFYPDNDIMFDDLLNRLKIDGDITVLESNKESATLEMNGEKLQVSAPGGFSMFTQYGSNDVEQMIDTIGCLFDCDIHDEHTINDDPELQEALGWNDECDDDDDCE